MNNIETFFPEHFTRTDRRGVITSFVVAVSFFVALINATPQIGNRKSKTIAQIEMFKNSVKHKDSGSVSFYEIAKNEKLQNEDEIFTGAESAATVKFLKSKTTISIPANSLVKIEETIEGQSVEVKEGFANINLGKNEKVQLVSNGKNIEIKSGDVAGNIKAYYQNGELKLFSESAGLKKTSPNGDEAILQNKEMNLKNGVLNHDSSFNVLSPAPGEKIDAISGIKINTDASSKYTVSISKNADLSNIKQSTTFSGKSVDWEAVLDEGEYFIKIDNGSSQKTIPITLSSSLKVDGHIPADGETVTSVPGDGVVFRWNALPVKGYKLIVRDSAGKEKVFHTTTNEIKVDGLKGSSLEWAVLPEVANGKFSHAKKSVETNLKFSGEIKLTSTKGTFLKNVETSSFMWSGRPKEQFLLKIQNLDSQTDLIQKIVETNSFELPIKDIGHYKLEVTSVDYPTLEKLAFPFTVVEKMATWKKEMPKSVSSTEADDILTLMFDKKTKDLKNVELIITKTINKISTQIKQTLKESETSFKFEGFGNYCFQLSSLVEIPLYEKSFEHCLKYIQIPVFPKLVSAGEQVISYSKHNGVDAYKINVPSVPKATKYAFEIYKDLKLKSIVYKVDSDRPEIFWSSNRSGIYFFRYRVFDIKNRASDFSPTSKLIFPISPLSSW